MKILKKKPAPPEPEKELTGLEKARIAKKAKREAEAELGIEAKRRNPMEIWEEDKTSLRKSVNAKCYDCNGGELSKNRTRFCAMFECPLWNVRPYSSGITRQQCSSYTEE